jgi:hypothetical protein
MKPSPTIMCTTHESHTNTHIYIHMQTFVYLATNVFLTFIFKHWCLYMKHLGHLISTNSIICTRHKMAIWKIEKEM